MGVGVAQEESVGETWEFSSYGSNKLYGVFLKSGAKIENT